MLTWTLLLACAALAEDFELNWDDIDLDGDAPQLVDYTGSNTQAEAGFANDARVTVSLPVGNLKVRCTDGDIVRGGLSFKVRGDDPDAMKRYGDGIRLQVWGKGTNGGVKLVVPAQPSAVKEVTIDLNVVVPVGATLVATANRGWVEATGCRGFVTASAGRDGAYVQGALTGFKVAAATGDVKVKLDDGSEWTKSSAITATKGKATLIMGSSRSARIDARGTALRVSHEVAGTLTDTTARGEIGSGGPSLVIRAGAEVDVNTGS